MNQFSIRTDTTRFDLNMIHGFLVDAYWCKGISRELVKKAMHNSLAFGIFDEANQVGYARVITDKTTFAYLADVFVLPTHRGRGLSQLLMQAILKHKDLQNLRRFMLATKDAHGLYKQFGFTELTMPERFMQLVAENPYGVRT